jgi:hypothetical protein
MEAVIKHDDGLGKSVMVTLTISKVPSKRKLRNRGGFGNLVIKTKHGAWYSVPWRHVYSVHIRYS